LKNRQHNAPSSVPSVDESQLGDDAYELQLYISGATGRSRLAIENVKAIVDRHLAGRCRLVITDVYQEIDAARDEGVIVVPMLVKRRPLPLKRIIGDLSDTEHVLRALGVNCKTSRKEAGSERA
jgi:circadian clock protein KaiB